MAGNDEPVTSPDQRKPTSRKIGYTVGILTVLGTLSMLFGNHQGRVEDLWLLLIAGTVALMMGFDWLMVRHGLRE